MIILHLYGYPLNEVWETWRASARPLIHAKPLLKSTTIVYVPEGITLVGLSPASRQAIAGSAMATAASHLSRYTGKVYHAQGVIGVSQCTFDHSSHP